MKIQKVAANNKEALVFSVTETPYFSPEEDWAGITLPSEVLRGEGKRTLFNLVCSIILFGHWGFFFFLSTTMGEGGGDFTTQNCKYCSQLKGARSRYFR